MKSSDYNNYDLYLQEPCHKRALNGIKKRPIIFGLICFGVLAIVIIIIVSVSVSKNNSKKKDETQDTPGQKEEEKEKDICSNRYSDECLYSKMIAKQKEYPEGMSWTNNNYYQWKGGV